MSPATSIREGSHGEDESAGPTQNAAACGTPTNHVAPSSSPSPSRSSKRNDAAQLARELGSSSPWSETLMPQGYGITSPRPTNTIMESANMQEPGQTTHTLSQIGQDLDPPPAYSRTPLPGSPVQIRDPPAEAMDRPNPNDPVVDNVDEEQPLLPADPEQNQNTQHPEPDVATPLLPQPCSPREGGRYSRWMQRRKMRKRKVRLFFCAVLFFSIVASVLVGFLVGNHGGASWFRRPATKHGQPYVDTGRTYERHETTENIYGAYKLWERVVLTTTTGAIDVEIDPQPGDEPAVLFLSSDIGSVTVRISDAYLRRRNKAQRTIHTKIHSLTGTISAEILLGYGGHALVETTTGVQTLCILTSGVGPKHEVSNLTTTSGTGTQRVVLTSLDSAHEPISNIRGLHQSFATASLDINYSPSWLGRVHAAASPLGLASVIGDDLEYVEKGKGNIVAYRGSGQNQTLTEVISKGTGNASFKSSKRDGKRSVL